MINKAQCPGRDVTLSPLVSQKLSVEKYRNRDAKCV
jgi:hypothetical protein